MGKGSEEGASRCSGILEQLLFKKSCGYTTVHLLYERLSLHVLCEPRKAAQRDQDQSKAHTAKKRSWYSDLRL